jgi:hypothetical protein
MRRTYRLLSTRVKRLAGLEFRATGGQAAIRRAAGRAESAPGGVR